MDVEVVVVVVETGEYAMVVLEKVNIGNIKIEVKKKTGTKTYAVLVVVVSVVSVTGGREV